MKLPLTATILALETTFDYNVLIATGVSVVLVEYFSQIYFNIQRRNVTKVDKVKKVSTPEEETREETKESSA